MFFFLTLLYFDHFPNCQHYRGTLFNRKCNVVNMFLMQHIGCIGTLNNLHNLKRYVFYLFFVTSIFSVNIRVVIICKDKKELNFSKSTNVRTMLPFLMWWIKNKIYFKWNKSNNCHFEDKKKIMFSHNLFHSQQTPKATSVPALGPTRTPLDNQWVSLQYKQTV